MSHSRLAIARLVKSKAGILLDVSLGGAPQENAVTFADLKHDPRKIPWPLPDHSVHTSVVTHVLEYLEPSQFYAWFNELHRVMRPGGVVYLSGPYGGDESAGWLSDPAHKTRVIETSFAWLDPRTPVYELHGTLGRVTPKPFHMVHQARVPGLMGTVSYNITLQAVSANGTKSPRR